MTEMNKKILELVEKNASIYELSEITGLTTKQLFHRLNTLKNQGFNIKRKYYYNGDITYQLVKEDITNDTPTILTSKNDIIFEAMLISDLHLSNEYERIDLFYKIYDFCSKYGINIILNLGDVIDGLREPGPKKINTIEKQIEYMLKVYPYDKNILNFLCLGNHDYDTLQTKGIDLSTVLENKRHDIISLGYGIGKLNIKNDTLIVSHPLIGSSRPHREKLNGLFKNKLILCGHRHTMKCSFHSNNSFVYVPSLSDLKDDLFYSFPSALKMTITFNNGYFNSVVFEHLLVSDKIYKLGETKYYLNHTKDNESDIEKNIEVRNPIIVNNNKIKQKIKNNTRYDVD